jgi:hypothetical protein
MMRDRGLLSSEEHDSWSARVMMPRAIFRKCTGNAWFLWVMHCGGSEPGKRRLAACNCQPDVSFGEERT